MSIEFLGEVENESSKIIKNSRAVVTATGLFEPTLLCEASTLGVPSVFQNGGIGEFLKLIIN